MARHSKDTPFQESSIVHRLQRERGVTCGFVAGSGSGRFAGGGTFASLVAQQRKATDALLWGFSPREAHGILPGLQEKLDEIRGAADASVAKTSTVKAPAEDLYQTFQAFNNLIKTILDSRTPSKTDPNASAHVLEAFTRLKEANGIERAFLCGALALPRDALSCLPSRAFADLVLTMEQQRAHEATVRAICPPKLLELIRAGFVYSAELREVQERLREDFDVGRLREFLSAERCWQLFTDHIDKLESLQTLLHNELVGRDEASAASLDAAAAALEQVIAILGRRSGGGDGGDYSGDGGGGDGGGGGRAAASSASASAASITSAAERLAALPPELIKSALVRSLAEAQDAAAIEAAAAVDAFFDSVDGAAAAFVKKEEEEEGDKRKQGGGDGKGGVSGGGGHAHAHVEEGDGDERRRRRRQQQPFSLEEMAAAVPEDMRITLDELAFVKRVGRGAAGNCYLARRGGRDVAVKLACGGSGVEQWRTEAIALARLRHPNIVKSIGVIIAPPSYGLALEFCAGGDLSSALQRPTPPGFLFRVSLGVAGGMAHLHSQGVLHRDLKGANVLLTDNGDAKLTDFGLAVNAPDDTKLGGFLTAETGTYRWMAPEVIRHERYSKSADVFSFGGVLFELLTHEVPFADRPDLQAAVAVGLENMRPTLPRGTPSALAELIKGCWERELMGRPTFSAVSTALADMPSRLGEDEILWLDAPVGHPVYAGRGGGGSQSQEELRVSGAPAIPVVR